ncbi:hypothetical protein LTR08_000125 [Meristemomyces frigidus]|nr:hypothetical protein LTR08_000125 [Meristemomyces frigidus]
MSTPTRSGRGMLHLDIDTKPGTAFSLGGFLTPPQSAHESRQGSLQYASYSEPFSSTSSLGAAFSTPPTPANLAGQLNGAFAPAWTNAPYNQPTAAYMDASIPEDVLHSGLPMSHCVQAGPGHCQDAYDLSMGNLASAHNSPPRFNHSANDTMVQNTSLSMTLYQSPPGMVVGSGPLQSTYGDSLSCGVQSAGQYSYGPIPVSYHQQPQVVVPSHTSLGEGWSACGQFSEYPSPGQNGEDFSSGFGSVNTSFSEFDSFTSASSEDAFLVTSEDEYLVVKHEPVPSPTPRLRSRTSGVGRVGDSRARRRGNKRGKPNPPRAFWWNNENCTEVLLEGKWHFGDRGKAVPETALPPSKPHHCPDCTAKFERSEHLKRHQKTHSDTREYLCPLPGCDRTNKGISRSDNATDHFKTHLKGPRKGQRNKHFEYPELRNCLLKVYPPKEAHKMISKLEKACRTEHELVGQQHHVL